MIGLIEFISSVIGIVWQMVLNWLTSLVDFVVLVVSSQFFVTTVYSYVPGVIGASVLFVITIGIIKLFVAIGGNQ